MACDIGGVAGHNIPHNLVNGIIPFLAQSIVHRRQYLLNLISRAGDKGYAKEPLFGLNYRIVFGSSNDICQIISEDGIFMLHNLQLVFEGE